MAWDATTLFPKKVWLIIMGALSKKQKKVIQKEQPKDKYVGQRESPSNYSMHPAWNFNTCDDEYWAFSKENVGDLFWTDILPKLKSYESQSWTDILVKANKQNHPISTSKLNTIAINRLAEKYIEQDSIISLRLNGTHRIYGYLTGFVFNILWFDKNHGDNDTCVCRSYLKHT